MKREGRENERKVGYAIRMQNTAFTRRFLQDGLADGLDEVTIMHGWIMGYLHRNEDKDIYQKTIESEFGIGRSSVTSLVKLMEKKGYIRRETVPGDARLKKIVLTSEGKATAIRVKETLDNMELDILKGISQEELQTYFAVVDKIKSNLDGQKS
ncbi:MAG: MarR family transcriptional regulator [Lachnospiraceae bacterium]|nr:MarR family transcriptional regulator [Lachnospiraceae bacterium]MBQ6995683.1 MarR family transcriptional regulator [Lachnospiraceae bacterium]